MVSQPEITLPQSVQRTPAVRPVSVQAAGTSGTCAVSPVWAQAVRVTEVPPDTNQPLSGGAAILVGADTVAEADASAVLGLGGHLLQRTGAGLSIEADGSAHGAVDRVLVPGHSTVVIAVGDGTLIEEAADATHAALVVSGVAACHGRHVIAVVDAAGLGHAHHAASPGLARLLIPQQGDVRPQADGLAGEVGGIAVHQRRQTGQLCRAVVMVNSVSVPLYRERSTAPSQRVVEKYSTMTCSSVTPSGRV